MSEDQEQIVQDLIAYLNRLGFTLVSHSKLKDNERGWTMQIVATRGEGENWSGKIGKLKNPKKGQPEYFRGLHQNF